MSENLHDIDDLFREPVEAHEEMPSTRVWEEIDHRLDKKNIVLAKKKYNTLKLFSAALLLLLMSVIVFQLVSKNNSGAPAGKPVDAANTETTRAAQQDGIPAVNAQEKPAALQPKTLTGETPSNSKQAPEATAKNERLQTAATQASTENKMPIAAKPAAVNSNDNASATKGGAAASKETADNTAAKATPGLTKALPAENNTASQSVVAVLNSNTHSETAAPEKAKRIKNNTLATGTIRKAGGSSRLTAGETVEAGEAAIAAGKKGIPVKEKIRNRKFTLKQRSTENNTAEESLAADGSNTPLLSQGNTKGTANTNAPVRLIRPLTGVWIVKNSDDESAVAPINVNIGDNDALPEWVKEKTAVMPVLARKSPAFHISVMPFYSPQFSFNRIETDEDHRRQFPQGPNDREKIRNDETYTSSSAWGVLVGLPLGKKWGLQSGFSYNTRSVEIQPKKVYAQLANDGKVKYRFDCSSGYTFLSPKSGTTPVVGDSITVASSSNNLQYIGIPLKLNYTFFGTKKFNVIPELGLMANFLVKQSLQTSLDAGTSQKQSFTSIQGLRKTYFNGMAGLGLQYNLGRKISLNLVPAVNFAFNSINQNAAVKSYLNSFSVTGGIKLQF